MKFFIRLAFPLNCNFLGQARTKLLHVASAGVLGVASAGLYAISSVQAMRRVGGESHGHAGRVAQLVAAQADVTARHRRQVVLAL